MEGLLLLLEPELGMLEELLLLPEVRSPEPEFEPVLGSLPEEPLDVEVLMELLLMLSPEESGSDVSFSDAVEDVDAAESLSSASVSVS